MKKFFRYNWFFTKTSMATKINGFFFYFRKIPLFGALVPPAIFKSYGFKSILGNIASVIAWFISFPAKFLWLYLYILISQSVLKTSSPLPGGFIWLMVVAIITSFFNGFIYTVEKKQLDFTNYYHVSGFWFYRSKMLYELYFRNVICYIPAFIVVSIQQKAGFFFGLNLLLAYSSGTLLGLYWDRFFFKHQVAKTIKTILGWGILLFFAAVLGGVLFLNQVDLFMHYFLSPVLTILLLLISGITLWKILTYKKEYAYIQYITNNSSTAFEKAEAVSKNQYLAEGIQLQDKMKITDSSKFSNLQGSNYLNALLFDRFKDSLQRALMIRLAFIWGIGLVAVVWIKFGNVSTSENDFYSILPLLIFFVYIASLGKKIVQMCFINCDAAMLYYPFYREAHNIRNGLTYRLVRSFLYNSIICGSLFIIIALLVLVAGIGISFNFFVILALFLLSLTLFFSFHELFVYYLLQPFTADLAVVNPAYKMINGLVYLFAYINLQARFTSILYLVSISVISILYVLIGYLIIQKKAPKTFRLK